MTRTLWTIAMLLSIAMLSCERVKPEEVVGTWVMRAQSRQALPAEFKSVAGKIVVNTDGTFVALELPVFRPVPPDNELHMRLFSGHGAWALRHGDGSQDLQLDFVSLRDEGVQGGYGFPLTVTKLWSAIKLSYLLGDSNENRVLFEREQD